MNNIYLYVSVYLYYNSKSFVKTKTTFNTTLREKIVPIFPCKKRSTINDFDTNLRRREIPSIKLLQFSDKFREFYST